MCLHIIDDKDTKKYKKYPTTIIAYKILQRTKINGKVIYVPLFGASSRLYHFRKGINTDTSPANKRLKCNFHAYTYKIGFHSFLFDLDFTQENITRFISNYFMEELLEHLRIVKVYIDPKDVVKVGWQHSCKVIVSKAFTIKSFKNCLQYTPSQKHINAMT